MKKEKKKLLTKNNFDVFEVRSLLQKAIRRNDVEWAAWAVQELLPQWSAIVQSCLIVVACEDVGACCTAQLLENIDTASRTSDSSFPLLKATLMLCASEKSRETDNFIFVVYPFVTESEIESYAVTEDDKRFAEEALDSYKLEKCFPASKSDYLSGSFSSIAAQKTKKQTQRSLFEPPTETDFGTVESFDESESKNAIAVLRAALRAKDKRMAGWACCFLNVHRHVGAAWDVIYEFVLDLPSLLHEEVVANYQSAGFLNAKKARSECSCCLQLLKSAFIICGQDEEYVSGVGIPDSEVHVHWRNNTIGKPLTLPEYTFDIHTFAGKAAGKTKNDFLFSENAALSPKRAGTVFDPVPGIVYG